MHLWCQIWMSFECFPLSFTCRISLVIALRLRDVFHGGTMSCMHHSLVILNVVQSASVSLIVHDLIKVPQRGVAAV